MGQLATHPYWKQARKSLDLILLAILITSGFVGPVLLGAMFIQKTNPCHRFVKKVLEVDVKFEWAHAPFIVSATWSFTLVCSILACTVTIILLYLASMSFWLSSLKPRGPPKIIRDGGRIHFDTWLGDLEATTIMDIYRSFQVLNRLQTECLASPRIATHQSLLQIGVVVCAFCSIRYPELIFTNVGYIVLFIGVWACLFIEFAETTIITFLIQASRILLKGLGKGSKIVERYFRGKILRKRVKASWALRIDAAYPYYEMSKRTFWEFVDVALNQLVNALLADFKVN